MGTTEFRFRIVWMQVVRLSSIWTVKITIFLKDLNDYNTVNKIYSEYFPNGFPARTCVQVARIPLDALIEIEAVGVK